MLSFIYCNTKFGLLTWRWFCAADLEVGNLGNAKLKRPGVSRLWLPLYMCYMIMYHNDFAIVSLLYDVLNWFWLLCQVLCVFSICSHLNVGDLFTSKLKFKENDLDNWDPFTRRTWQLGPIWIVDPSLKKEILELLSQNGHGPKIKRLRCSAWPMKLTNIDRKNTLNWLN